MDNNYGHTVYLDRLQNNKHETVKALEKLGKRAAAVVHEEQRWHHWVRECQEKEEEQAQSEAKKVKLEFQLFKRYEKELDRRQRDMRSREIKRREEQYLNQVYAERAQTMSREEEEEWEEQWDPIQDIYGYERGRYVELINMFLMISEQEHEDYCAGVEASQLDGPAAPTSSHQATGQAATGKKSIIMETKEQMRRRLQTPVNFERAPGQYLPEFLSPRTTTPVVPHDEIETLLDEICEIKNFLFCRLLLASSALLPIALQAGSIEELLQSEGVTREHLRDVCLKLERPSLENMRDACADFMRERDGADAPKDIAKDLALMDIIDAQQRIQIRVCGRHMYYYRNERALNRSGWFHFSIIAKDSELADAVALCRNWEEFFELTILSMYRLFPAPKWTKFVGDVNRQCLLLLGFIPYFQVDGAEAKTTQHRISGRASSGRSYNFKESRNILCGIVKRDDTLNRRFLECLAMESADLRVLVHDPVTGKFVIQPPKEEFWLSREKAGRGRSTKHEYTVTVEVDNAFFEQATACRAWSLNFNDYYNVYIWDAPPGRSADELQGKIQEVRKVKGKDMLVRVRHIVQHITNDRENRRVRSIRPGENVPSMLDDFELGAEAFPIPIDEIYKERFFTEIDEIEDALLYPRRAPGDKSQPPFPREIVGKIHRRTKWKWWKIASDASTDEESSASDEESFASDDASEAKSDEGSQKMNDPRAVLLRRMLANDPHVSVLAGKAIDKLPSKRELDAFGNHGTLIPQFQWADRSLGYDHFLPMFDRKRASVIPSELRDSPSKLMDTLRTALRRQREYDIQGKHLIRELCGSHGQRSIHRGEFIIA
ncbi:uncharacterized protein J4E79_000084 [Alternaria viburni]|uniref:uncharacterized protein n=1 Tax=Alternaria viburni TaxID=566460 RepID=UPI0020C2EC59|nr:uncharacterized protein J4E79_000084 [Alternaria viburni]KAI4669806.1 hypothetical protein J4E79_000084 [Alternaria viburni]